MFHFDHRSAQLLFDTAREMGLQPKHLSDFGLTEIIVEEKKSYFFQSYSLMNSQWSSQMTKHKHLTRIILDRHNFPNIPYLRTTNKDILLDFMKQHDEVIAKPVMGSRSKDIIILKTQQDIESLLLEKYLFEKYIVGKELRLVVLKNEVVCFQEKRYDEKIHDPAKAQRISYEREQWDTHLVSLAQEITKVFFLGFAAVDFFVDRQGNIFILEVNSAPCLYRIQNPDKGPSVDIARIFLEEMVAIIKKQVS